MLAYLSTCPWKLERTAAERQWTAATLSSLDTVTVRRGMAEQTSTRTKPCTVRYKGDLVYWIRCCIGSQCNVFNCDMGGYGVDAFALLTDDTSDVVLMQYLAKMKGMHPKKFSCNVSQAHVRILYKMPCYRKEDRAMLL